MSSKFIVHIDDYGVTENYSLDVLQAINSGVVDSVSILANGFFTDKASALLDPFKAQIQISVHLNISEGRPLSNDVHLLQSSNGEFRLGFSDLILLPILSTRSNFTNLKKQIKSEFSSQIEHILKLFPHSQYISIDGHRHIHLIPFIFDIVVELTEKYHLQSIRIIDEPFYFATEPLDNLRVCLNGNLFKHFIVNFLSMLARKKLTRLGKDYLYDKEEKFLGILFSDLMAVSNISSGLSRVSSKKARVLLHPGTKLPGEPYTGTNPGFMSFYESKNRLKEKNEILGDKFKTLYRKLNHQ